MTTAPPIARSHIRGSRARLRRRLVWVGLASCVLIAAVWAATLWARIDVLRGSMRGGGNAWEGVFIEDGCLVYRSMGRARALAAPVYSAYIHPAYPHGRLWWTAWVWRPGKKFVAVPLSFPLVIVAVPTVVLIGEARRSSRAVSAGACEGCGYNLRGLGDGGVCPECGTALKCG